MVATGNPRGQGRSWSFSTEETSAYWNKFEGGEKDSRQSNSGLSGRLILKDDQRSDQSTDLTPTHTKQSADEDLAVGVEQIFLRLLRGLPMEHWRYWYWVWWISAVGGRYVFPRISWCTVSVFLSLVFPLLCTKESTCFRVYPYGPMGLLDPLLAIVD